MPKNVRAKRKRIAGRYFDYNLLAVVIILICFGLVMLYSASFYKAASTFGDDMYFLIRQTAFSAFAVVIALVVAFFFDYHWILRWLSWPLYVLSLGFMFAARFTSLGTTAYGASRWIEIGPISFQPAEIAKIALILVLTREVYRLGREAATIKGFAVLAVISLIPPAEAYLLTNNLSTAVIMLAIAAVVIFVANPRTLPFLIAFGIVVVIAIVLLNVLLSQAATSDSFRIDRILVWMDPEKYSDIGGFQVLQGLYAIGSGGLFGRGLGNSTQKLGIIPEAQNDMIFSIICEELGLFGAIIVLLLFGYLLYRLYRIALRAPDLSGTLVSTGVFIHIALQVILNICVVLNVIPTTGVSLPLISNGGTAALFTMIEIGIVMGVSNKIVPSSSS